MKIKSIKINSVRGIKDLDLELNGKSLLLYGENGTGKSSLVDAFELFFTGEIEHITNVKSLNLKKHCPHIQSKSEDVAVKVEFDPGSISVTRKLSRKMTIPDQLNEYFTNIYKSKFILRRDQILEFIYSPPSKRYEAIGEIMGIKSLNDIEETFMKVREHFKGEVKSKENAISAIILFISKYLDVDIQDQKGILHSLNKKLENEELGNLECFESVEQHIKDVMRNIKDKNGNLSILERLTILISLIDFGSVSSKLNDLKQKYQYIISKNENLDLQKLDFLKIGSEIIQTSDLSICPFCNSQLDKKNLLLHVAKRIDDISSLTSEASGIKEIIHYITSKLEFQCSNLNNLMNELVNINIEFTNEIKCLNTIIKNIETITKKIENLLSSKSWIDESKFKLSIESFETIKNEISIKIKKICEESKILGDEQKILKIINIVETVRIKNQEIENLNTELSRSRNLLDISNLIYSTYSKVKKVKIQEIHNGIQEDIEKFYSFIHKNEEHGNIKLIIDLNKKGSTDIKVNSFDSYVDPRAFQSEGHLDSLGLCIFLAFVKKFNKSSNLIILDDIVTTIDSQHRMRICELLYENFQDKQLILTTHDNVWFEQLISFQNRYDIRNNFLNLKIDEWTINNGPKLSKYLSREERINKKLESNDKNSAGNEIRQYLEFVLKELCENIHAEVPFKNDGKYMIDELLNSSKGRLKKLIKDVTWKNDVLEIFKEIESVRFLSNILSHDNLEILQISISEIRYLYTAIKNLENKFKCNSCLKNLEYDRNGSLIRCVNKKCKKRLIIETI